MSLTPTTDASPNSSLKLTQGALSAPGFSKAESNKGMSAMTDPTIARIALVDDDDLFRESLSLNLGDEGYEVITFDRGEPALDFFAEGGAVDIVLLDWRMPKLDGIDVLRHFSDVTLDFGRRVVTFTPSPPGDARVRREARQQPY